MMKEWIENHIDELVFLGLVLFIVGFIVGAGIPEEIASIKESYTGQFLKEIISGPRLDRKTGEEYTFASKMR